MDGEGEIQYEQVMKSIGILLLVSLLAGTSSASASWFEFCDFEGTIASAAEGAEETYDVVVAVSAASRSKELGDDSYTDCHEYMGKPIEVTFDLSELPGRPARGDHILFSRSVIDGFDRTGAFSGTSIRTRFLGLQNPATAAGGR